jgi:trimeric autotransporter adhesin
MHQPPLSTVFAVALCAAPAFAQLPSWSPEFGASGLGGVVFATLSHNGDLYAGGQTFDAAGGVIHGIARYDGSAWRPVSTGIGLTGSAFPFTSPQVRAFAVYQGQVVLAGTFNRASGLPCNQIALWNGTTLQPLGQGLQLSFGDADVRALAIYNNDLYAAGKFDRAGGLATNGVARWNGTSWSAVGSGVVTSGGIVGYPYAMHEHNGTLIVGGEFDRAGGLLAHNIASWNGTAWSALGSGPSFTTYALTSYGTDLVAAAQFQIGSNVEMLARWDGTAWSALGTGGPTLPVSAMQVIGTELYAGGQFSQPGPGLARWNGITWSNVGGVSGIGPSVATLCEHNGELVVGGDFETVGMQPGSTNAIASSGIASFDGATTWRELGTGLGLDRQISAIVPWRGGWAAAGNFTEAGSVRSNGLAFYDGDRWSSMGAFNGSCYAAALYQGGLVVSGNFTSIDGVMYPGIAMHDGTQWQPFGGISPPGMIAYGGDLFGFGGGAGLQRWNGFYFATAALPGSIVSHAHIHTDGLLYLTTDNAFTHLVHVWNGTTTTQIGISNDFQHALSSHGSELVLGGRFTSVSGTGAFHMARWNGVNWSAMPASVTGYSVDAFGELEGVLYAGVSGDPRGFCLKLMPNGWQSVGAGTDSLPQLFFPDPTTASLWVSGPFYHAGGLPSRSLAEWRTQPAWRNRLHGLAGSQGIPQLSGRGAMQASTSAIWTVDGPANMPMFFGIGLQRGDQPLLGGTLVPVPDAVLFLLANPQGQASLQITLPPGFGPGARFFSQAWLLDASGPQSLTATNALECISQ